MILYQLSHTYDYGSDRAKYKEYEESRILGVYYTKKEAIEALLEYKKIRGFRSHLDGFWIDKIYIDKHFEWLDGYTTEYYMPWKEKDIEGTKIYVLSHFNYANGALQGKKHRILSVCSTISEARKKIREYQKMRGFSSHISNFYIEEYILDNDLEWIEGYQE